MMHITPQASAYLENVWLWVADHDIDDPDWNNDNNVMVRGFPVQGAINMFLDC